MAGTRGQEYNVAGLSSTTSKTFSGGERFIWNAQRAKVNDIVYSYQNIDTPINFQPVHETSNIALSVTPTVIKKQIIVSTPASAINFTTSTAVVLIDGLFGGTSGTASHELYEMYKLYIINLSGANAITLVGNTGVSLAGNTVVAAGASASFDIILSAATAVSILRAS
tara:strand:+ start:1322 stop:1825 length:504 start_codon:yes stop_codon:yes gene_type:complete